MTFAVGAVLGDVFLHLLPELMGAAAISESSAAHHHNHSDEHHHHHHHHSSAAMNIGLYVIGGMMTFFAIEKLLASFGAGHSHHDHDHHHHHDHHHGHEGHNHSNDENHSHSNDEHQHSDVDDVHHGNGVVKSDSKVSLEEESKASPKLRKRKGKKNQKEKTPEPESKSKSDGKKKHGNQPTPAQLTHAYLHTFAGATHCFADGLTLCLSFIASPAAGLTTAFAVLLHEIPHKIGDYAILRGSGLSKEVAIRFMFLGASGSFLGAIFGASVWWYANVFATEKIDGENKFISNKVMPFTAGGLVYLALVGVLPELSHTPRGINGVLQTLSLLLGMAGGVYVMANMSH
ncbi:hypothetical protein HK098_007110 [Nowakowskiella sp. JEL0407]|nr:hypothetical protein HK098_007110 [Nowakowskiella sp. JEL0407]